MPSPFRRICLLTSAMLVSAAVPAAAQTTTAITPTAYWNFDTDAKDSSGNGHHGTVVSVNNKVTFTKVTGEFVRGTGALKIDNDSVKGHSDFVDVMHDVFKPNLDAFTIVTWFKRQDIAKDGMDARNFIWETSTNYASSFEYYVAGMTWRWWLNNGGVINGTNATPDDGKWHHVAVTWDRLARKTQFWFDGKLVHTKTNSSTGFLANHSNLHIGDYRAGNGGRNWDGFIDDFAVFPQVLPPCYILGLFDGSQLIHGGASCYGTGCHGMRIGNRDRATVAAPLGSPKFAVTLSGAPATKPATCCLGLKTTSLELGFMDAPGCHLLLSLDLLLGTTTDSSGKALQSLPIPPVPSFAGLSLYAEWYVLDPAINKAGLGTSGGLAITILK